MMVDKSTKMDWRVSYKSTRIGAGYFLRQHGRLKFTPEGYISFRGLNREDSNHLIQEWDRWIRDLQDSSHEHVRNAATHAPSMCSEHLDAYYRDRVIAESEITSLENSSKKLADSEQEPILLTQKRRGKWCTRCTYDARIITHKVHIIQIKFIFCYASVGVLS
jgi:hypothetical protein